MSDGVCPPKNVACCGPEKEKSFERKKEHPSTTVIDPATVTDTGAPPTMMVLVAVLRIGTVTFFPW